MNRFSLTSVIALAALCGPAFAQDAEQSVSISLPIPEGDNLVISAHLTQASLDVIAANVTEVIVEAQFEREEQSSDGTRDADGFTILNTSGLAFDARTTRKGITINAGSWETATTVTVQVPANMGLKVWSNQGDWIRVSGLTGDIEVSGNGADVILDDVSGHIVADASNSDLVVNWTGTNPTRPMAFTSQNGDVDVTLPDNLGATLKLQSRNGSVKTAFDVTARQTVVDKSNEPDRVRMEAWTRADINGGGPEITLRTYNGDLIIRNSSTARAMPDPEAKPDA